MSNMKALTVANQQDMANVKVFANKQTDKRTGQKLYTPDLSMRGGGGVKNIEGKEEIARHEQFLLFSQCFN